MTAHVIHASGRGSFANEAQKLEQAAYVFERRKSGVSFYMIAKELRIGEGTARNRYKAHINNISEEMVGDYRKTVDARYDAVLQGLLTDNPRMTPRVAEAIIALETSRARLLGLNVSEKIDVTVHTDEGLIDDEVSRLVAEMGMRAGDSV